MAHNLPKPLASHARTLEIGMSDGHKHKLWLDQGFGEDLLAEGDRLALPATTQPAEIVALVSRQEERLIGELERLARECPTPDTAAAPTGRRRCLLKRPATPPGLPGIGHETHL